MPTVRAAGLDASTLQATSIGDGSGDTSAVTLDFTIAADNTGTGLGETASHATVRVAEMGATSAGTATARLAEVTGWFVIGQFTWDGTGWVDASASAAANVGTGVNTAAPTIDLTFTVSSSGNGQGAASLGTLAASGSLDLSGAGILSLAGTANADAVGQARLSGGGTLTLSGSATSGPPPGGAITATVDLGGVPRVLLQVDGVLGTQVRISRLVQGGTATPVRTGDPATLNGGSWVGFDYEAPFGQPVTYRAVSDASGPALISNPVTVAVTRPWLIHPGIPGLSQPLHLSYPTRRALTRPTAAAVHLPLSRKTPIVITDGQRKAPTFPFQAETTTAQEFAALDTLLDDDSTLLLQVAYPDTDQTSYDWVSLGDVGQSAPVEQWGDPLWIWTATCTVVDRPAGLLQAIRTFADLLTEASTLGELKDRYVNKTLRDVLLGDS